jgi:hypothetical protein
MTRLRVHLAALAALAFGAGAPAFGQSPAARIEDIQMSREGEGVSILVKLSQQPTAASAKAADDGFIIEIEGIELARLAFDPPQGAMVRHVEASGRTVTLSGAALGEASTVIYRNAVLVEAKLADPKLRGASLMTAAPPAPSAKAPPAEAPKPSTQGDDKPIDLAKREAPTSRIALVPLATPKSSAAALANIDEARCVTAAADVQKDPWAIPALGDHALCLIDKGNTKEAVSRLDQLAAFAPEDWRIALGRAVLAADKGDASNAEIGYRTAAALAPSETIRAAIKNKLAAGQSNTP